MFRSVLLTVVIGIPSLIRAMDVQPKLEKKPSKPIIALHLSIVSDRENPDAAAAQSAEVGKTLFSGFSRWWTGVQLLTHKNTIDQKGKELAKTETGTVNVTHLVLKEYGVTEDEIKKLAHAAINPQVKKAELSFVQDLKKQGYKIVGITDQDHVHHEIFRQKATEIDLNELLEGVITIPYLGDTQYSTADYTNTEKWYREHKDNWYIVKPGCQTSACQALRKLVDSIDPEAPIVMIDIKKNSEEIPAKSNIASIQYESLEQLIKQLQDMNLLS